MKLPWAVFLAVNAAFIVMAVVIVVGGDWLGLAMVPIGFMVASIMAGMALPGRRSKWLRGDLR